MRLGSALKTALLVLGLSVVGACGTSPEPRPNFILVMADDQGWGDVGYNGHPVLQTPTLDNMAQSGLRFDRFYAAAPVCSPTRASVLTGRHPNRLGCLSWGHTLRPQEITVAEALRDTGYTTGHFGKWHLGSVQKGSPVNPGASGFDVWFSAPNFFDNNPILSREGTATETQGESSSVVVDAALEFIREEVNNDRPFLAVVWFGSPHNPHEALPEDRQLYPEAPERAQHYYGEITAMDRAVGRLRDELRILQIQDHTLFWYTSDNGAGQAGSPGDFRGRKGQVYDGGLLVPAILEWPERIAQPRVTTARCNSSDIYPTLLELAGVQIEHQPVLDGISLVPLLQGKMERRTGGMGFWKYPMAGISTPSKAWMKELLNFQKGTSESIDPWRLRLDAAEIKLPESLEDLPGHSAWIDQDWKLHRVPDDSDGIRYELYNLSTDPREEMDLYGTNPDQAATMIRALDTWQHSVIRSLKGQDYR